MNPPAGELWKRLAPLRMRLLRHARPRRHIYRGRAWYVIEDSAGGQSHRISAQAWRVIGRLDGTRTLEEVLAGASAADGEASPSTGELSALILDLHRLALIATDRPADLNELSVRARAIENARARQRFLNPFSIRIAIADPDRLVSRIAPWLRAIPGWAGWVTWGALVAAGVVAAALHWRTLTTGVADHVFALEGLLLLWLCYPLVKLLHELAHALAIKLHGGEVHEIGILLLVFMPVPYVDGNAAAAMPDKRARMLIGAAGILVELAIAAAAILAWTLVSPGIVRSMLFTVAAIGSVSTLLFNGNPLLRFDAYYVLSDWLEIPNLGQRASAYLGFLARRHAFGAHSEVSPAGSRTEAAWLLVYGLASFGYRIFVTVAIVLFVAAQFFFIGVVLALWAMATMLLLPVWNVLRRLATSPDTAAYRAQAFGVLAGTVLAAVAILAFLPLPSYTLAEGVVWAPEGSQVRADTACFVRAVAEKPGARVERGALLIRCDDPELQTSAALLRAQLAEQHARESVYLVESRLQLDMVREQMRLTEAQLADIERRIAGLDIRSPARGSFVMAAPQDAPGRWLARGVVVAYVLDEGPVIVRALVRQADVDLVRADTHGVALRTVERVARLVPARIVREVPSASDALPSLALTVEGGGAIAVDPKSLNPDGSGNLEPRAMEPVFQFDLELAAAPEFRGLGHRAYLRIEHSAETLAPRAWRALRRLFLRSFAV